MTQNIKQLTEDEVAKMHSQGIGRDQSYVEGVGWCVEDINSEIIGRSPDSMQVGRPIIQSDGNVKFINPHPAAIKSGLAPEAEPEDAIDVGELKWSEDNKNLLLPVDIHFYPDNRDELLGMVESKDPTRGGWLTMSALEALGSGLKSSYTETVRNATEINFVIRSSYSIEKHDQANFKLYFRKSNERTRPEYTEFSRSVPTRNADITIPEPQKSFLTYALEYKHGLAHQLKWTRVLLATGFQWKGKVDEKIARIFRDAEQSAPMDYEECLKFYERHGRNKRWTLAKKWFEDNAGVSQDTIDAQAEKDRKREQELNEYKYSPPIQGNFSVEDWINSGRGEPNVVFVYSKYGEGLYIVDPQAKVPLWKVDGDASTVTGSWKWKNNEWTYVGTGVPGPIGHPGDDGHPGYTSEVISNIEQAMAEGNWNLVAKLALEEAAKS